jgi:hypothetical protein
VGENRFTLMAMFFRKSRILITRKTLNVLGCSLAALVGLFGIAIALMTLRCGVWYDEFFPIAWTAPGTSPREFLHLMITREYHPILHYGMVYLLQAIGVTDIALLRSINLLGLPLVIFAVAYGMRHKLINLSQALIVWVLFASSPIFFEYVAELRCYFLLYSASIATAILWYVLMRHIEARQNTSATAISIWGAYLAIFVNLHYFATLLGGMLTAVLLTRLAIRSLWSQVLIIAGVSLAAAAPALVLGALQVFSSPKSPPSWIVTSPIESIKLSVWMVKVAAAWNVAAVAGAVVTCLFVLEDRRKRVELRTAVILLGVVASFLGALVLANAITPLIVNRYLIAGAGAVTFAVAILAASSGTPVWLPAAASAVALLLQAQTIRHLGMDERGWLPSARAVAQLNSECPTTKIFAYPRHDFRNGLKDIDIRLKFNQVSYGYYAKMFQFSYEDLWNGATVVASGPCPSVIWIEHVFHTFAANPNANTEQVLNEFQISKIGVAELKRYGSGVLIIVRDRSD